MKICLVSDYLIGCHKNWSGAEMVVKILAKELKKEGQSVAFITTQFGENKSQEEIYQLPIFINHPRSLKKFTAPISVAMSVFSAVYYLLKAKPDVVHLFHTNYIFLPVATAAKLLGLPLVFTFLDYYLICPRATFRLADGRFCNKVAGRGCRQCISSFRFLERPIMKFFSRRLAAVITFTETSKKRLLKYGFEENKIRIIYTYNISQEFSLEPKQVESKNILFIGSFHEHKGLRIAISALAEVLKEVPEAKLNIIGSGNDFDRQQINELINNLAIRKSLDFLGQKSNEEVLETILKSKVVVVAEQWPSEFGPLTLLEAMALGRPVVSGNLGSPAEFIKNGENGFLVDYNQPDQYAQKIIWLLKNKEAAEAMGKRARLAGKILFNYDQGKKHINLYQELIY